MSDLSVAEFRRTASWRRLARALAPALYAWLGAALVTGCTYRFTNSHVSRPAGIRSIAVEAIYDTSREVVPHELLWEALQSSIATDGHLVLASQGSADALLRAHLRSAPINPTGSNFTLDANTDGSTKLKDPAPFNRGGVPPAPSDFLNMGVAQNYEDRGQLTLLVDVEVYDLNTHAVLLKKSYTQTGQFQAVHSTGVPSSSVANDHLRYDESMRAEFKTLSVAIANQVVTDLLPR